MPVSASAVSRQKKSEAASQKQAAPESQKPLPTETPTRTVIGWQGVRFQLPPEWNLTGFSMDRDNGYIRVDSPGSGAMSVQVRWTNAAKPAEGPPTPYYLLAPYFRKWLRRPAPAVPKTDLKASLEKILKDTARQAKKAKAEFESHMKPEKVEGPSEERTAINFTWSGNGRGQGKIWRCDTCNRVVVAQVVGLPKDHNTIATIASQLFATVQDHAVDGYDLWALYDLQVSVPEEFRLESQQLMSGHLRLVFGRGAERIILDRWGLANMTLKKFALPEWFEREAFVGLKQMAQDTVTIASGHEAIRFQGKLPVAGRLAAFREAKASLRRFPSRYEGGAWLCAESNKIFAIQVLHHRKTEELWSKVVDRCVCH